MMRDERAPGFIVWVCCTALAGCAGQAQSRQSTLAGGEIHDPADEWAADHRPTLSTVQREPRILDPARSFEEEREAPMFTTEEIRRIRLVQEIVRDAAQTHGVPSDLVNGIIWVESRFQQRARGRRGPRGLMQLMPRTGREVARALGRRYQPYDPDFNIDAGTYYLARMVSRFDGNVRLALAAYNIGPGTVASIIRDGAPLPEGIRAYVDGVFSAARAFRDVEL
jgi:hypothetical protein